MSDTTTTDASRRQALAHHACIVIGSMAAHVQRLALGADADDEEVIRQLAVRIEQASGAAMAALDTDADADIGDLEAQLHGPQWARDKAREAYEARGRG